MVALLSTVQSLPDEERAAVERALVPLMRRAAVGALAVDIAHDAGNSLFGLSGLLDLIVADEPVGDRRRGLLLSAARELDSTLTPLLRFARAGDDAGMTADLGAAAHDALALYRHGERKMQPLAAHVPADEVRVGCPASLTLQAVVQLLLAADPAGELVVGADGTVRVAPARETSLEEIVTARIAADHGGSVERVDDALVLRLPQA